VHGDADPTVPYSQKQRLHQALDKTGRRESVRMVKCTSRIHASGSSDLSEKLGSLPAGELMVILDTGTDAAMCVCGRSGRRILQRERKGVLMRRIVLSLLLICCGYIELRAQAAATFHIFPQVADGIIGTTAYVSSMVAVNVGSQPANCTYRLYGGVSSRISGPPTFTLAGSGSFILVNTLIGDGIITPLATGYGTLTCSQAVAAFVAYINLAVPSAAVLAGATVFSSPPTTRAELVVIQTAGYRTAMALANDTDTPVTYQVSVNSSTGLQVGTTTVPVPARSNVSKFVDEIIPLPASFTSGSALITSASTPFSAVGLIFNGSVFFTEPTVSLAP
jgi:hypothetical protein